MLLRSMEAAFLNSVVNHPSVKPWVSLGLGDVDLTDAVMNPNNIFLANAYGGFLFVKDGSEYECHTQFLPEGRGTKALQAAREAARYIFDNTEATAIRTYVPRGNVAASALTRRMGFAVLDTVELLGTEMTRYVLTREDWICQQH